MRPLPSNSSICGNGSPNISLSSLTVVRPRIKLLEIFGPSKLFSSRAVELVIDGNIYPTLSKTTLDSLGAG